jgi:short-subunit dehydrogenase
VVAITGASAGVGRAVARIFAKNGYDVGLIARGSGGLEAALKEVESQGQRGISVTADVADPKALERAAGEIEGKLGPIDVWVNNAMTAVFAEFDALTPDEFRRVTEVTYLGTVYGTMAALRRMKPRDRGVIVQVGSALAYRGIPLQSAYCGAKHAAKGFIDSLRAELLHDGSKVRVPMVQLPALNTPQFSWSRVKMPKEARPIPPIYQPEIAARAILWTAEHPRREILVGFPTYATVLANKLFPGLIDRFLAKTGFQSQQTDEVARERSDNLMEALDEDGDFGSRGRFDERSRESSPLLWVTAHRFALGLAGAASVLGAQIIRRRRLPS